MELRAFGLVMFLALSGTAWAQSGGDYPPAPPGEDSEWVEAPPPPPLPPLQEQEAAEVPPSSAPTQEDFDAAVEGGGTWVNDVDLGRVWQPSMDVVGADFVPYSSGGDWFYASSGWVFRSPWRWGWATFHYGRWCETPTYGWVWQPSFIWGPAWVQWRRSSGYVAWSPLPPNGWRLPNWGGASRWSAAPAQRFGRPGLARYTYYTRPRGNGAPRTWSPSHAGPRPVSATPVRGPVTGGGGHPSGGHGKR
jgi:hypothetical protein